ncbi:MAG TPA: TetR family transcriptional regulator [Nitrolancea sp.]|nr:TetR family transcriptional regulator [Nitrolancea sp.]
MKALSEPGQPIAGLRERKKAKTRAAIRRHALQLFRAQGYANTTIEQIVDATEVSQSTFFRYFPTKEEVVLQDDFDELFVEEFKRQPLELSPLQAMRAAMRAVFSELSREELDEERERQALIMVTPELRSRMLDDYGRTIQLIADLFAERLGRVPDAFALRVFAGALIGAMLAATFVVVEDPEADLLELMDTALSHLEAGLPL